MQQYWIAVPGGEPNGPHGVDAIRSAYAEGRISRDTLACPDGGTTWIPVADLLQAGSGNRSSPTIRNDTLIHVALPDGQRRTLRADALQQLLASGKLSPDTTQCWIEGMQDWCTARVMFKIPSSQSGLDRRGATVSGAETPSHAPRAGEYVLQQSPFMLAKFLEVLLWVSIPMRLLTVAAVYIPVLEHLDAARRGETLATAEFIVAAERGEYFYFGELAWGVLFAPVFLMWFHRIVTNCHGFGAKGMRFSAGGAVGWFFVPIVNFWYPRHAMDEACRASKDPDHWAEVTSPGLVNWWWGLIIATWVLWMISYRYIVLALIKSNKGFLDAEILAAEGVVFAILESVSEIALSIVTILLVSWLTQAQRRLTRGVVEGY